jgi:hypothetical protein
VPCVSAPAAIDVTNRDATRVARSPPTCAAAVAESVDVPASSSFLPAPAPAAAKVKKNFVQEGSRVRIDGLQAKPQHNGRTGVVCGAFDAESGRWTVAVDASDAAGPAFQISIRSTNLVLLPDIVQLLRPPAPLASANTIAPHVQAIQEGSRVRIEGLQAKPLMNGRTGVVRGSFNQETGRWTVDLAGDSSMPACHGSFREANLRLIPSHNFSTEWIDEGGCVWPKNVDFSRQCAKGHTLAPLGKHCGLAGMRLMCRLCLCFCRRGCKEAASWLMCSEDAGCCGEYAVCCRCARSPSSAATCAGSDDFCTLVS